MPNAQLQGSYHMVQWKILGGTETKNIKTALGQCGMLRIWECDCAFCVIGNEFPCRQPHNPTPTLLRGLSTLPQG